jgi:hypothetical protein
VLDAYSRRNVGWSTATTLATRLVLDALNMALAVRRPKGVIHHSDKLAPRQSAYCGNRDEVVEGAIDADPIAAAVPSISAVRPILA